MKRLSYAVFVSGFALLVSCSKAKNREMTVVHACGSYLNMDGKNYKVCNAEVLDNLSEGTVVRASFKPLSSCKFDRITCAAILPNEAGWIEVTSIEVK